ncbi:MAG: NAD(P)H-dependent glycerol-3-phosphate dehydrogenase [Acidobacteriota bacterium]|nr:NAD(P)H-dependent glycerol-3-phosphate dehydrogenase [Acidobacteriota bacterium]
MNLGILGGGSWGTALAIMWARNGHQVDLWVRDNERAVAFREAGCNTRYLPDIPFPDDITVQTDLERALRSPLICMAVPLQAYRGFLTQIKPLLRNDHRLVLLSKGIELGTHLLPTQIVKQVLGQEWQDRCFTLSGPSFAQEVARDKPTTVVLAGTHPEVLKTLQSHLNSPRFRMYRNTDVTGVELCGALKNVIAIAAGITTGMELGANTLAGLITRGLSEISRLGVALGAQRETFAGLAGMGDLILTCNGKLSRNLRVGMALAKGYTLEKILNELGMVAEGVHTSMSAYQLGSKLNVELPITNVVHAILYKELKPHLALHSLMTRSLKSEVDELN